MAVADRTPRDESWRWFWHYSRALAAPVLIWLLLVAALGHMVFNWLQSEEQYDLAALQEWIDEARNPDSTLAELVEQYLKAVNEYVAVRGQPGDGARAHFALERMNVRYDEINQHLKVLCEAVTKVYPGQLPLFPVIYRMEVSFDPAHLPAREQLTLDRGNMADSVIWDSGQQASETQYRRATFELKKVGSVKIDYQMRAWNKRQRNEQLKARRLWQLGLLALGASGLGLAWLMLVQADERERQRQRELARDQLDLAERNRLDEERKRVETERKLLEQKLATQAAESHALELKSHLYASIGIMAGSYAHNIKNLLVRPNDLLRRCLEGHNVQPDHERMLREVQQTLGTVTERLQQILHTVRRDPAEAKLEVLDLNLAVRSLAQTWSDLAADRWHLDLVTDLAEGPLLIAADSSHLQQAAENLIFNARDATFEMRNHHRDAARRTDGLAPAQRKQKVIEAAAWRGKVVVRTQRLVSGEIVLEVRDNGAGMTEDVRRRCTETHYSTKRDNALYHGHSTGMGLGLSFVVAILEHHEARLEIESEPQKGTTFRARFPAPK